MGCTSPAGGTVSATATRPSSTTRPDNTADLGRKTVVFTLRIQLIQTRISCIFILNQLYFLTLHFFLHA